MSFSDQYKQTKRLKYKVYSMDWNRWTTFPNGDIELNKRSIDSSYEPISLKNIDKIKDDHLIAALVFTKETKTLDKKYEMISEKEIEESRYYIGKLYKYNSIPKEILNGRYTYFGDNCPVSEKELKTKNPKCVVTRYNRTGCYMIYFFENVGEFKFDPYKVKFIDQDDLDQISEITRNEVVNKETEKE